MRTRSAIVFAVVALLGGANAHAQEGEQLTVVDTLGAATPASSFDFGGAGGAGISAVQNVGPRFVLEQPTVISEIGAFVNNCASIVGGVPQCPDTAPFVVRVLPATPGGLPDMQNVLATFVLSHDDDPLTYAYESVAPELLLEPGTYFALFGAENEDAGALLANAPGYEAGLTQMGLWVAWWPEPAVVEYQGAVRILGRPALPTSKDQCKDEEWRTYPRFKNQGDCVSYVTAGREE
jgi:hypothetical protein